MENTNNLLAHRQVDVIRKNLLSVFRFTVKALIDKACFCSIDDGCEEFVNFCATMEHILLHRLRPSKAWYLGDDRSHFWFYIKAACHRQDLRGCITNIDNIENIKSPVAKGRAFVRCALMEKRLSEYLGEALKQTNITRRFYKPGAIMLREEASEMCGILLGLNSIDFGFCIKGENYDTVECPLAISYTPFMKFKQSQESLHSDLEEMRELSCGSSLASEEGQDLQDTPPSDTWPERFNTLHKRYLRVLEQKSFLEEVTASQEKALQAAAAAQQEVGRLQREAAFQKRQYESVILELQAQVARMKTIHESLQQQLMSTRGARFPMVEMDRRGEKGGEASRFAAAMGHKLDSDRHSLTSSYDRSSVGRPSGDTRSLASAMSEISVDVVGQGQGPPRTGEDTQSMVPLTGSLGDLHLELEPGLAVTESSNVAVPEQSTPVVSISSGVYASTFLEINGNGGENNIHLRETSSLDIAAVAMEDTRHQSGGGVPSRPSAHTAAGGGREASGSQQEGDTATKETGSAKEEETRVKSTSMKSPISVAPSPPLTSQLTQERETISDHQSEGSGASEPEELVPESSSGAEEEFSAADQDSQDPEVLSHMTSSKESAISSTDKDDTSEPEVLAQEEETFERDRPATESDMSKQEEETFERDRPATESDMSKQEEETFERDRPATESDMSKQEAATVSMDHSDKEDSSDPEILEEQSINKEARVDTNLSTEASGDLREEGATSSASLPSSDREETSEPELLTQEDEVITDDTHQKNAGPESGNAHQRNAGPELGTETADPQLPATGQQKSELAESESTLGAASMTQLPVLEGADHSKCKETSGPSAEEAEKEGGSDSGSSDENKDTWDMLSDANHDSSS